MGYIKIAADVDKKVNTPVISPDGSHKLLIYLQVDEGATIARYMFDHISDLERFGQTYASYRNSVLNYNKDKLLRSSNFRAESSLNERLDLLETISNEQGAKENIAKYEKYLSALLADPKTEVQDMFCEISMIMYLDTSKHIEFFNRTLDKLSAKIKQLISEEFPDAVDPYAKLALFYHSRFPVDMRNAIVNYYKTVDQPKILEGLEKINLALDQAYSQRELVNSKLDIFELMQDYTKIHKMVLEVSDQKQNPNILILSKIKTQAELSAALLCIVNEFEHRCEHLSSSLDAQLQVLRDKGVTFDAFSAQVKMIEDNGLIEGTALDNLRTLQTKLSSNQRNNKLG